MKQDNFRALMEEINEEAKGEDARKSQEETSGSDAQSTRSMGNKIIGGRADRLAWMEIKEHLGWLLWIGSLQKRGVE
ncbi:hypothetical protein SDJN03_05570, partial [Cucurbita argyrosperma subsp. sororia]